MRACRRARGIGGEPGTGPGRVSTRARAMTCACVSASSQGVTRTPFRVVDEINQGMDSRNERKVRGAAVAGMPGASP